MLKIASVVGARPQFVKIAPLCREFSKKDNVKHIIIHTGQHYDYEMSKVFFDELGIPEPNYHLGVGSGTHGYQIGEMLKRAEEVLLKEKPGWVLVYGDTNSTLAGALAAIKLYSEGAGIPVAHIEAGLRSYNKKMPEEINRVLTDHISTILFCPTKTAVKNLEKEGLMNIANNGKLIDDFILLPQLLSLPAVLNVGDIMYDAMLMSLEIAEKRATILETCNLSSKGYYLATVHRAENTDNKEHLTGIVEALIEISKDKPIIWPIHPRAKKQLEKYSFKIQNSKFKIISPLSYFDMLILEKNAHKILTDSGGIQKEAYWLKVPCVTLRDETEWVETVEAGWNVLAGADKKKIIEAVFHFSFNSTQELSAAPYGDGQAAERIVEILFQSGAYNENS
ncbi:UDP-N-acetylglucosamine 2-epimerase (non-hydrolyzing) [Thermodesulfovibrionales bacterium]|nr:UDP-N-acetylglucosamine 2-epimerase (non-hydrolyzing) [Thermodesulfovibrionales bacterium]